MDVFRPESDRIASGMVALAGVSALTLLFGLAAWAAVPARPKAQNPHWTKEGCGSCHHDGKRAAIPSEKADEICLKCHDGQQASMEFHPVGRVLDTEKYNRPQSWPMPENRLACLTCHDMKLACSEQIGRPSANRMMLRDFKMGRSQSQPFCQNCHKAGTYQKLNPHVMLLAEKDEIIEEKCLFCHETPQDRKAMVRAGKPSLKGDQGSLCRDCHPQHKDTMMQGHIGMKLPPATLAYMAIREQIGLRSDVSEQMVSKAAAAGTKPKMMVPAADGTITCSTCHNPHQHGVFPGTSELAFRGMRLAETGTPVSPVHGQAWCRFCHAS